jgi:Protein of unknown function (DUF2786)
MHSKQHIMRKVLKLLALAERPGSKAEGIAAAAAAAGLRKEYGITDEDLELRAGLEAELHGGTDRASERDVARGYSQRDGSGRPEASDVALADHQRHPDRVHLAYDYMSSVCGVRPTFVWVFERDQLLTFDDSCPHCLATGIFDTRRERKRLTAT